MRGSGWLLPVVAVAAWIVTVAWPLLALGLSLAGTQRSDVEIRSTLSLVVTSIGWGLAVACGATILGWAPGRMLGRAGAGLRGQPMSRDFLVIAVLLLVPICLPSYLVFYAWWQSWPAESQLHQWIVSHQSLPAARQMTLFIGLVCWSWPLVSLCVAGVVAGVPATREELMLLDGAGPIRRMFDRLRLDGRGLAMGALLVFLATLANTTCFDLAEVFTFANELRAIQALGATAGDLMVAAAPAMMIALIGAATVWWLLAQPPREVAPRIGRPGASTQLITGVVWGLSVLLPVGILARNVLLADSPRSRIYDFFTLYGWSVWNTLGYAFASATVAALMAVGLSAMWFDRRKWIRSTATIMSLAWLLMALLPGTLIGTALQRAYNRGWLMEMVYLHPAILIIAHVACFGFVAALLARWVAMREPVQVSELRSLDGAQTLHGLLATTRPRMLAAATATFAAVFVLAIGEIPVTALVNPPHRPGAGPLALTLLNDMHYQRPEPVMIAAFGMLLIATAAALVLALVWRGLRGLRSRSVGGRARTVAWLGLACTSWMLCGCTPDDPDNVPALRPTLIFGAAGGALGQFAYPRAIDVDAQHELIYVVDKGARVQRFGFDGKPQAQWLMPESASGKPTGVSVAPDGRVFVADTHYFRVIVYDSSGNELMRFGEFGRGPGQFIYVTDVAFGPDDRLYVSEYGGNDRVQVFDSTGRYLFEFGQFGEEHGRLNRPQSLAFSDDGTQLYIADACNHRIVVVNPQGQVLRTFGQPGRGFGQLTYPYGLTVLRDGSLLVAEFGNNRLQHFNRTGQPLGLYGQIGRGPGQLQYPWSVAAAGDRVFVLDSGNNRVQVIRTP